MKVKSLFPFVLAIALAALTGCGGSGGEGPNLDPNGVFRMELDSSNDGFEAKRFDIEMEASKGKVVDAIARIIESGNAAELTTEVVGIAEEGFLELTAQFESLQLELEAESNGLSWHGTYTLWDSKNNLIDDGTVEVFRSPESVEIAGNWTGDFVQNSIVRPAELQFFQKGNEVFFEGTLDGQPVEGSGSVFGRSIQFELAPDTDAGFPQFLGGINAGADHMTGSFFEDTFDLVRVE